MPREETSPIKMITILVEGEEGVGVWRIFPNGIIDTTIVKDGEGKRLCSEDLIDCAGVEVIMDKIIEFLNNTTKRYELNYKLVKEKIEEK